MLQTYLKAFFRNLRKDRGYSVINVLGFTAGMTSFILIVLFVLFELSYDRFYSKSDQTYRLSIKAMIGETRINQTYSSARMFTEMRERYPEIEAGVKLLNLTDVMVRNGDHHFYEPKILFADSTFFNVFDRPVLQGDPSQVLTSPNTLALSKSGAERWFGAENAIGKIIELDLPISGNNRYEVTGIFEDIPANSHFHTDILGSLISFPSLINHQGWSNNNFITYFLLNKNASYTDLEEKFKSYVREQFGDRYEEWAALGNSWEFFLQPLQDIHLKSDLNGEFESNGNMKNIYLFSIIAFFVLLIASINFMNLSTARSIKRSREVGIRKVVGSTRGMLIRQFLSESVVLTFFSMLLAVILVKLLLPGFNNWLGMQLGLELFGSFKIWAVLVIGVLVIGILSGLYPSFFMATYKPVTVLKSQSSSVKGGIGLRNLLVIIQFASSVFLIIGTLTVNRQMNFLNKADIGFKKENVLIIRTPPSFVDMYKPFKEELEKSSIVQKVTASSALPAFPLNNIGFRADGIDESFTLNLIAADHEFDEVLGLEMAMGRFFDPAYATDTAAVVLNETAVKVLNLEDPIGKRVFDNRQNPNYFTIIGVVKDFNYESMHSEIRPMGIFPLEATYSGPFSFIGLRYQLSNESDVVSLAQGLWSRLSPGTPFVSSFLEDDYHAMYGNEQQTSQVFSMLALLAILVACLGLIGLLAFITQKQTREIAVRKVFGATPATIIRLFSLKFSRWVLLAIILATPIAWYVMQGWLQNFQYKTGFEWWIFVLSGSIVWGMALITIVSVTWRAAMIDPATSLKYE